MLAVGADPPSLPLPDGLGRAAGGDGEGGHGVRAGEGGLHVAGEATSRQGVRTV